MQRARTSMAVLRLWRAAQNALSRLNDLQARTFSVTANLSQLDSLSACSLPASLSPLEAALSDNSDSALSEELAHIDSTLLELSQQIEGFMLNQCTAFENSMFLRRNGWRVGSFQETMWDIASLFASVSRVFKPRVDSRNLPVKLIIHVFQLIIHIFHLLALVLIVSAQK